MSVPISILFATAQRPQLVRQTLEALVATEKPALFEGIWVVENGTRQGVEQIVADFSPALPVHYLFSDQASKPASLNFGLSQLPDSLVYMIDDDVRFYPATLTALAKAAGQAPRNSYFGGPFDVDYDSPPPAWLVPWLPFSARGWSRPYDQPTPLSRGRFIGFNWAVYRDDLRTLNGFDPSIGPGSAADSTGDETELQGRLKQQGFRPWYVPQMRLAHYVPESRCSPEWAIDRAYRHGVGWGQLHRGSLLRRLLKIKAYAGWQWARHRLPTEELRGNDDPTTTLARLRESKWRGRVEGLQQEAA